MINIISILKKFPLARYTYARICRWRDKKEGKKVFKNNDVYLKALTQKGEGTVVLRTHDNLNIKIRLNIYDARIIREIFFRKPYIQHLTLPPNPIIIDIGGYIGDFSLYAVKYLNARRVIVYEPTAENFKILKQNIEENNYLDRITAVNKGVSDSDETILNVQINKSEEVHVSSYLYKGAEQRRVPSITLSDLFEKHQLDSVDLLKIDCEGGEYDILSSVPEYLLKRIKNIAFEYHRVDGFETKLNYILKHLKSTGYKVRKDGDTISAYHE